MSSSNFFGYTSCLCMYVCVCVWVMFYFRCFLSLLTHRVRDCYFVCAIGGQHDGHLPFWLRGFVKFIMLKLYVFVCIAEINILLLQAVTDCNTAAVEKQMIAQKPVLETMNAAREPVERASVSHLDMVCACRITGWLKIKYPTRQYAISLQSVV